MSLNKNTTALLFAALAALAIVASVVLIALGNPVPDFLPATVVASLSALAALAYPTAPATGPDVAAEVARQLAAQAGVIPAQYARPVPTAPALGMTPAVPAGQ